MVFRKKSERETKIKEAKKRLSQIDDQIDVAFEQAKTFAEKGEMGKASQGQTRWAILIDKRKIIATELDNLTAQGGEDKDRTVAWSEETARLFYAWLKENDLGYYKYLVMIKDKPEVLKKILAMEDDKG